MLIIKKKRKTYDKKLLQGKAKLNTADVYKALINSYISYDKFSSVNNILALILGYLKVVFSEGGGVNLTILNISRRTNSILI